MLGDAGAEENGVQFAGLDVPGDLRGDGLRREHTERHGPVAQTEAGFRLMQGPGDAVGDVGSRGQRRATHAHQCAGGDGVPSGSGVGQTRELRALFEQPVVMLAAFPALGENLIDGALVQAIEARTFGGLWPEQAEARRDAVRIGEGAVETTEKQRGGFHLIHQREGGCGLGRFVLDACPGIEGVGAEAGDQHRPGT